MNTHDTKLLTASACLFLLLAAGSTSAAPPVGAVIGANQLKASHRALLKRAITGARLEHSAAFKTVASMRAALPSLARRQRGRMVTVVLPLRALGKAALMPMLSELAFESAGRGGLSERAWRGWRVSLLEAVGSLGDFRAAPVLEAIVRSDEGDIAVVRTAARGLARMRADETTRTLLSLSRCRDDKRRRAVLAALGECRRPDVARALAAALRTTRDETDRGLVVGSLGQVGNLWAWRTLGGTATKSAEATRRVAVEALVAAYPGLGAVHRDAAAKALLLIGHPTTHQRIAATDDPVMHRLAERLTRDGMLR